MLQEKKLLQTLYIVLNYFSARPHNSHSNVKMQFLSLCRLQQPAMPSRLTVVLVSLLLATPAVISWLWLVIVPIRVKKLCPEECWCDAGGYVVDCSGKALHSIPSIYLTQVQELILIDNNITCLEKDSFISKGMIELYVLVLHRCRLQTIELGAFNGLTSLMILSMRGNGIGEIKRRSFENMRGLVYLGLNDNKIKHLDFGVFSGLINLQHINLEGNEILKLHPDIFVGLPKLERLYLDLNLDLQIPTDRHFITSLSLKYLDITHCNIGSVSVETFAKVSALERLALSYNNMRSVDINILKALPKLSELYLEDNPLRCDCQLQEVWRWCQDHDIRTDYFGSDTKCDSEIEGKREWGWALKELKCVQDNASDKDEYKQKHYKYPDDEYDEKYKQYMNILEHVLTAITLFLSIVGITGNVFILIIIKYNENMRIFPNMYIRNLAISDMIYLTSVIIANIVEFKHVFWCTFFILCLRMSVGLSAYSVALLSIQRYRVTVNPFHVLLSSRATWHASMATIFGLWIVAVFLAIPSALSKILCFGRNRPLKNIEYYKRVALFELFVSCVYPLCVIAFSYVMTARHLVKSSCPISEETQNPQLNTRQDAAKIVVGLTVVFLISYVPFHVCVMFSISKHDWISYLFNSVSYFSSIKYFYLMLQISGFLLLINSCLNPVAIFCTSNAFRNHLKRYLTCFYKTNSPPTNMEFIRRN